MELISPAELAAAAAAISAGSHVIVPTARWYMVCCDASNRAAAGSIFAAKKRPRDKSLVLELAAKVDVASLFDVSDTAVTALMAEFWPGDLAFRLRWRDSANGAMYECVGSEIALVTRSRGVIAGLAEMSSCLIAATSINIAGAIGDGAPGPCISPLEVIDFIRDTPISGAFMINGGICPQFNHMTIVDASDSRSGPVIEREGVIHRRAIEYAVDTEYQRWRQTHVPHRT